MTSTIQEMLNELNITQAECADYMSVDSRTVRRWIKNPNEAKKSAVYTLEAWIKLKKLTLPWRPNEIDIIPGGINLSSIKEQINGN